MQEAQEVKRRTGKRIKPPKVHDFTEIRPGGIEIVKILRPAIKGDALGQLPSRLKALGGGGDRNHRLFLWPLAHRSHAPLTFRQQRCGEIQVVKGRPRYLSAMGDGILSASKIV